MLCYVIVLYGMVWYVCMYVCMYTYIYMLSSCPIYKGFIPSHGGYFTMFFFFETVTTAGAYPQRRSLRAPGPAFGLACCEAGSP